MLWIHVIISVGIAMDIEIAAKPEKGVNDKKTYKTLAIQNDLSSAIHWPALENTIFDAPKNA